MLTGIVVYPLAVVLAAIVGRRAARSGLPAFVVAMRILFVLYLGWVAGATLFPLPVRPLVAELEAAGTGVDVGLVPLATIRDVLLHGTPFAQAWILGGNVLTLAPFGFLLPFVAPRAATWPRMVVAALFFPLAIELSQLAVSLALGYSYRVTEVDDVLLNFAGVLLGFAAYVAVRGRVSTPGPDHGTRTLQETPTGQDSDRM
jgi:glycopeptide antibiotics resistance protein